jgi:hypothetical protein
MGIEPMPSAIRADILKPVRLEGSSSLRLASECIITDANIPHQVDLVLEEHEYHKNRYRLSHNTR